MRVGVTSGQASLSYSFKACNTDHIRAKHKSEYMYVCPKCGRHAEIKASIDVGVSSNMETAKFDDLVPTHDTPSVYIVPSEGISVHCSCGCGMIAVDKISAKMAFMFMKEFNFKDVIIPEPFIETGLGFTPSEISFTDPITSSGMKKLITAINKMENNKEYKERYPHVVSRVICDEKYSLPAKYVEVTDKGELKTVACFETDSNHTKLETEGAYVKIFEILPEDCIRYKSTYASNEFVGYMSTLMRIMKGNEPTKVLYAVRATFPNDYDGDPIY